MKLATSDGDVRDLVEPYQEELLEPSQDDHGYRYLVLSTTSSSPSISIGAIVIIIIIYSKNI